MESSVFETIADWAERGSVAFTILAAASGLIFVLASRQLKRFEAIRAEAKDARAAKLELDVATQQERAAKAETDLLQLRNETAPRTIRLSKGVVDRLKRNAGTVLRIEYRPGEREPHRLAERIAEVTRWAQWKVEVTQSEESEIKFPTRSELREGVDIGGGGDGFQDDDDAWSKLPPKYKAAEELWKLLRANGIDATYHLDAGLWEPDKPIIVKIWPKPLPYSAKAKLGTSWELFPQHGSIQREVEERNDAEEKKRLEWNEHLRKEWYPDGEQ